MDPHHVRLPRKILIGNGVLDRVSDVCEELNLEDGMVLVDPVTLKIAGDRVAKAINADIEIAGDVTHDGLDTFEKRLGKKQIGFVLSVGGGKVIDFGKFLAMRLKVPFFSVPTAPSHDGIASERVSVKGKGRRYSVKGEPPVAIVADIQTLMNAPYKLIASGGADVISNCTAVFDWKIAARKGDYYSDYAAALSLLSAEIVMHSADMIKGREERGIRNLVEALISSGISMSLAGTSRPASGSEHLFSHALDMIGSKALHGEQCGVGAVISAYLQGQDWARIRDALIKIGAPVDAEGLGVSEEMVLEALLKANKIRKRYTILDEQPLDKETAREICLATRIFK